jgi:hypothetical protein
MALVPYSSPKSSAQRQAFWTPSVIAMMSQRQAP